MKAITNIASGWLLALTFAAVDTAALAAEARSAATQPAETQPATTQPTSKRLQFEVSTEARGVPHGTDPDVNYLAAISIRDTGEPEWSDVESGHGVEDLERTLAGQSFSDRQRAMLQRGKRPWGLNLGPLRRH